MPESNIVKNNKLYSNPEALAEGAQEDSSIAMQSENDVVCHCEPEALQSHCSETNQIITQNSSTANAVPLLLTKEAKCTRNDKNIKLAKFAGFCYGVKRAVETAKKLKSENPDKNVFVLGELIHNSDVINELENLGIKTLKEIPEKGDGICVIRSHGESPQVIEKIKNAGFEVVDLTCLDVKKVQQKAVELAKEGYFVVIVGKSEHPEVIAIRANAELWSEKVVVAVSPEQLKEFEQKIKAHKRVGVVVQTTQRLATLNSIVEYLTSIAKEIHIANTICQSTSMRQTEAKELAKESDLVIVVGSKKSANTTHLAEILKDITKTIHIENDNELENYKDLIENSERISITAGASTPQNIIEKVMRKLQS